MTEIKETSTQEVLLQHSRKILEESLEARKGKRFYFSEVGVGDDYIFDGLKITQGEMIEEKTDKGMGLIKKLYKTNVLDTALACTYSDRNGFLTSRVLKIYSHDLYEENIRENTFTY